MRTFIKLFTVHTVLLYGNQASLHFCVNKTYSKSGYEHLPVAGPVTNAHAVMPARRKPLITELFRPCISACTSVTQPACSGFNREADSLNVLKSSSSLDSITLA